MSIRALALELYRANQNVEALKKRYEAGSEEEKIQLRGDLKAAQHELQLLRKMLDGEKESGAYRKRFHDSGSFK